MGNARVGAGRLGASGGHVQYRIRYEAERQTAPGPANVMDVQEDPDAAALCDFRRYPPPPPPRLRGGAVGCRAPVHLSPLFFRRRGTPCAGPRRCVTGRHSGTPTRADVDEVPIICGRKRGRETTAKGSASVRARATIRAIRGRYNGRFAAVSGVPVVEREVPCTPPQHNGGWSPC